MWNRLITRDGSILYEVNPDHPLVESIVSAHPELQTQLEALLKQIGMSLPINSLYIDLTNDEKMDNDNDNKGAEVITLLKNVISTYSGEDKQSFIEALLITDPFCNYSDEIESAMKRGEIV